MSGQFTVIKSLTTHAMNLKWKKMPRAEKRKKNGLTVFEWSKRRRKKPNTDTQLTLYKFA